MERMDFMTKLHAKVQEFEQWWNRKQREEGDEIFTENLTEAQWWDMFFFFLGDDPDMNPYDESCLDSITGQLARFVVHNKGENSD